MKALSFIVILILIVCNFGEANGQIKKTEPLPFRISRDTAYVDINGILTEALLIGDKYYCFFEERDPRSTMNIKRSYVISLKGKVIREIKIPEEVSNAYYYDIKYRRDSIIVMAGQASKTFFLDQNKNEFIRIGHREPFYFEDDKYRITALCKGEWGNMTYFENKLTNKIYATPSGCPVVVNKLDGNYFVTDGGVLKIDPTKLTSVNKKDFNEAAPISGVSGVEVLFRVKELFSDYIPSSFTVAGKLYHFYNTRKSEGFAAVTKDQVIPIKDEVRIGTLFNNKFEAIYTFPERMNIVFQEQFVDGGQFYTFHTQTRATVGFMADIPPYREAKYGFIAIKGDHIMIHYFISKKSKTR